MTVCVGLRQEGRDLKKPFLAAAAAAAGAGAWCIHRNKKYPLRPELRFANKLAVPGGVLSLRTAALANRAMDRMALPDPPPGVARSTSLAIAGDGAEIPLTLYRPEGGEEVLPCLVYFHGGGFCLRDQGYIHDYAARYAQGAECLVIFVHYRTAEAVPFPTPFEDCYTALRWAWDNAPALGIDRERIAVGGDSAGGALAAACTLRARDESGPRLCFQLLVYPVTDSRMETPSMGRYTDSPFWNGELNREMWALYLREGDCGAPQYAAPMLARDFSGLPPAYLEAEEFDCLHDEGIAYAGELAAAGAPVQLEDVKGTFHGFDFFADKKIARVMAEKRIRSLRGAFAGRDRR